MIAEIINGKIKKIILGENLCKPDSGQFFIPDNYSVKDIKSLLIDPQDERFTISQKHPDDNFQLMSLTDDMNFFAPGINTHNPDEEFEMMEIM